MMGSGGATEIRKHSHNHNHDRKKTSLPGEKRRVSNSSLMKRSNSVLSSCSMTSSCRDEQEISVSNSTYLTPTQRKNQEIKRIRLELERANDMLLSKDKEITVLKKEIAALKESQNPSNLNDSWITETESAADSGNCEEQVWEPEMTVMEKLSESEPNKMDNIDFELMENALREEEEYRHKLEEENRELNDTLADLREQIKRTKEDHSADIIKLKSSHNEDVMDARKESNQKVEELIIELAESSMRCSRQQDAIEQRQLKIDELLTEVTKNKEIIAKLEDLVHDSETKDNSTDDNSEEKYLNQTKNLTDIAIQSELLINTDVIVDTIVTINSFTQTDEPTIVNLTDDKPTHKREDFQPEMHLNQSQASKSEPTCDNKIHFTYQFLRRSIYYYITDKDNRAYHLKCIQRLLEFSDAELNNIHLSRPTPPPPVKRY